MARRRIGQDVLALPGSGRAGRGSTLDRRATPIDGASLDVHQNDVSAAAKGEPAWPPLALVRALLIAVWYDPSDVRPAEALDDHALFRRFCRSAAHEPVPERTGFVRCRKALPPRGLDTVPSDEVTGQLRAKAVRVETGTLVDVTVIPSIGTCERSSGPRRMRWRDLAEAGLQPRLTANASNPRRTMTVLQDRCA